MIVTNPPYSIGQRSADDNASNTRYEISDRRLKATYILNSKGATSTKSVYDTYIRAFRWASDRIKGKGVVGFISNAGWLETVGASGIRACFRDEFSRVYVLNLRGNQRGTIGDQSRREGGKFFGGGSRAAIAITILVKDPGLEGPAEIRYYDIGDYLSTEQKRAKLSALRSVKNIAWQTLEPDDYEDWLNKRDQRFPQFIPLGGNRKTIKTSALFEMYSLGVASIRDAWAYNFSREVIGRNVRTTFDFFNSEVERLELEKPKIELKDWVRYSPSKISWSRDFFNALQKRQIKEIDPNRYVESVYRPFSKRIHYFERALDNEVYRQPLLFPRAETTNRVICVTNKGTSKPFSCLMVDCVPDIQLIGNGQCFPLYYQSDTRTSDKNSLGIDTVSESNIKNGMRYALSDLGLRYFQTHYPNLDFDKESLFYFIYGVLHSPDYRVAYHSNLTKEIARIPIVSSSEDFQRFIDVGRKLGDMHVNYESIDFPVDVKINEQVVTERLISKFDTDELRVSKMRFRAKATGTGATRTQIKNAILFNRSITVSDIPESAYDYIVNGRPAIEWIMDQYQVKVDKKTEIKNDPNDYAIETAGDPAYILKLLLRVIEVSLRTNELVAQLPNLNIRSDFTPYEENRDSIVQSS